MNVEIYWPNDVRVFSKGSFLGDDIEMIYEGSNNIYIEENATEAMRIVYKMIKYDNL